jgi:hypothetical protein
VARAPATSEVAEAGGGFEMELPCGGGACVGACVGAGVGVVGATVAVGDASVLAALSDGGDWSSAVVGADGWRPKAKPSTPRITMSGI